ncbi:MAG TPA: PDZ domain-containing protein [Planctomycetota bacterium]|jgi:C-terminal processing protease CtpA/Prc|nr:PDZ domain-containing protein [Planctomycetota bacterium]
MKSLFPSVVAFLLLGAPAAFAGDRAFLGVGVEPAKGGKGLLVQEVTDDSAAAKAGLKVGDVLLKLDGKEPADQQALAAAVQAHKPGEKVELVYRRGKKEKTIEVELGEAPAGLEPEANEPMKEGEHEEQGEASESHEEEAKGAWLGVQLETDEEGNVAVQEILPGSPARRVGMKKGDRILLFKGKPGSEIYETIADCKPGEKVEVKVKRGEEEKVFEVVLAKKEARLLALPRIGQVPRVHVEPRLAIPGQRLRLEPEPRAERDDGTTREILEEIRALRREIAELREQVEKLSSRGR